jgi:hypothetical protein
MNPWTHNSGCGQVLCLCLALLLFPLAAEETVRTGLEGLAGQSAETIHETERPLVEGLKEPLLEALDCSAALQLWFDGRTAEARGDKGAAAAAWAAGRAALSGLQPLPAPVWPSTAAVRLRPLQAAQGEPLYLVTAFVISWTTDAGVQYGLLMVPQSVPKGHRFPLLVYVHRGQDGIAADEVTWLGEQCRKGYAVVAPGRRGQPLADPSMESLRPYRSEGLTTDIAGESTDVVTAMQGAATLPVVRPTACALLGLGSGAAGALLAASRSPLPACVAVAEAERLNPFRDYWNRLARRKNGWPDWETFCNREPAAQLADMAQRSVVHQAAGIPCPVLMLLPEESVGTLDEEAHRDVVARLTQAGREVLLEIPAGTHRGFTADIGAAPAQEALRRMGRFVYRFVPPDDGKDAQIVPQPQPPELPHGN